MSSNANEGGDLFDMAKDGTQIPGDAGKQRLIPSVPKPQQQTETEFGTASDGLGATTLAAAADNATDIPRRVSDMGNTDQVVTGTGDPLPGELATKRLHIGANNPLAKGSQRYDKHTRDKGSVFDDARTGSTETQESG